MRLIKAILDVFLVRWEVFSFSFSFEVIGIFQFIGGKWVVVLVNPWDETTEIISVLN